MALSDILHDFRDSVTQCASLITNSQGNHPTTGTPFLPARDREQIVVAAFLNMFIAWETFLEAEFAELMVGGATIDGLHPTKYASPLHHSAARDMLIGANRYFDYANIDYVRKVADLYFQNGRPFEPHLASINATINDMRTLRNSAAHITSPTQRALETLALRITGTPSPGITLHQLLTTPDPSSMTGEPVFVTYRDKLLLTAELIARG